MVAFDATMLMLLLQPNASVPKGRDGQPVEHAAERVRLLIADLETRGVTVLIPTPALAEVLVRVSAKAATQFVDRIGRYWVLRVEPFDARAAIEVAAMTRDALERNEGKGDSNATWAKLKYDRQIVAVAKVNGATTIYSDDDDMRRIAARSEIEVVGLADLPLPAKKSEQETHTDREGPQPDFFTGGAQ